MTNPPERLTAEEIDELARLQSEAALSVMTAEIGKGLPAPMNDYMSALWNSGGHLLAMARASLRPLPGGERERVARIINPAAWEKADINEHNTGVPAEAMHYVSSSLAKADAILLALSPPSSDWPERDADVAWMTGVLPTWGSPEYVARRDRILAHLPKQKGEG